MALAYCLIATGILLILVGCIAVALHRNSLYTAAQI
jgi:uncharacterized membrane protein